MKQTIRAARLAFLAFGIAISCWAPMIPFVKSRLALNDAELGLVLLVFGIGAIASMPLSGWLIHRIGSRLLALASGLLMALIIPFLTIAPNAFLLATTLFFFGISTSGMNISINAQSVIVESQTKQPLMSGFHCLFSVGGLVGALFVSFLLELNFSLLSCALITSSVITSIVLSQYKKLLPESPRASNAEKEPFIFPENRMFLLGFLCFIAFVAEGSILDWSAEFLRTSLNYPASQAGVGYALFSIAMASGRFIGDRLIARFNAQTVFQAGALLAASGFAVLVGAPLKNMELLGFFMIGLGAANIVPILFSVSGKSSHFALTLVTSLGYAGLLIGPGLIGLVANSLSLPIAFSGLASLLVLAGFLGPMFLTTTPSQSIEDV